MKYENYIFSGTGYSLGKYLTTNQELEEAVRKESLTGFNENRIKNSKGYKLFVESNPDVSPFCYFVEHVMGFNTRNHVVPFPPTLAKSKNKDTALELAVDAVSGALEDAGIHPEKIDKWFFSNATGFEQAPGIAATVKCHFVNLNNQKPTFTVNSACVGFNINLQNAIEFLKCNPDAKHVIVSHTEVMSGLLNNKTDFVPFATFADAAAAVVLSKSESDKREGVLSVLNKEDMYMIDFLGADKAGNLYMGAGQVKNRATENIVNISKEILEKSCIDQNDIDLLIPHQTGNAIVLSAVEKLNFPIQKVYQEVQKNHGNLSGASVPVSISKLFTESRLKSGQKILCPVAGLGGEFGAFIYVVPEFSAKTKIDISGDLQGKTALVTGSSGDLGLEIACRLAERGCNLVLQYNSGYEKINNLKNKLSDKNVNIKLKKADFLINEDFTNLVNSIEKIDFLIHSSGVTGNISRACDISREDMSKTLEINALIPIELTKRLSSKISKGGTILYIGSAAEDAQFSGNSDYISSKRALHGFAVSFADELIIRGIRTIYYMPGIIKGNMSRKLSEMQLNNSMALINQESILETSRIAESIVNSLYKFKVVRVRSEYENSAIIRKDGYLE